MAWLTLTCSQMHGTACMQTLMNMRKVQPGSQGDMDLAYRQQGLG